MFCALNHDHGKILFQARHSVNIELLINRLQPSNSTFTAAMLQQQFLAESRTALRYADGRYSMLQRCHLPYATAAVS